MESVTLLEGSKKRNVRVEFCACWHGWNFTSSQAILIKYICIFQETKFFEKCVLFM